MRDWDGKEAPRNERPDSLIYAWALETTWGEHRTRQVIRGLSDAQKAGWSAVTQYTRIVRPGMSGLELRLRIEEMRLREYLEGMHG